MVQAEVADRLAARPGLADYGIPSVKAAWYADVRRAGVDRPHVFWPAPNVDSGLVAWTPPRAAPDRRPPARRSSPCRRGVRPAPQGPARRPAGWAGGAEAAEAALRRAGIDPMARGEPLDIDEFAADRRGRCGRRAVREQ